ncbi:hypothetical protein [uncultured Pluralibacter sp.]|uniref:RipA family octameric membrane protein n=1 Tax=uncultured Pluralibacter sp. TaxID=1490864 RepID=UPI00260FFC05|nr:hypothetical protein [uncultured Pluralibacter sp.]
MQINDDDEPSIFPHAKERLAFYRSEIHHEINSLAARNNALLAAQSFLIIAYASCMGNLNPRWGDIFTLVAPVILSIFGVMSSLSVGPAIRATYKIIEHWQRKQDALFTADLKIGSVCDDAPLFDDKPYSYTSYRYATYFSKKTPVYFIMLWIVLGLLAVALHYMNEVPYLKQILSALK